MSDILLAKLHQNGDMDLSGEIIEIEANWEDTVSKDETYELDEEKSWDDYRGVENFINYILDTEETWEDIEHFHFRPHDENLYTNNFVTDDTISHPMKIGKENGTIIKGQVRVSQL